MRHAVGVIGFVKGPDWVRFAKTAFTRLISGGVRLLPAGASSIRRLPGSRGRRGIFRLGPKVLALLLVAPS